MAVRPVAGLSLAVLMSLAAFRQSTPPSSFDVASVKLYDANEPGGRTWFPPGGRFQVIHCYLQFVIQQVYGVRDYEIVDAPKWVSDWSFRYNIEAKADPASTEAQLKLMAQNLLAERFQLKVHRETRDLPVYALAPGKNGVKLQVAKDDGRPRGSGWPNPAAPGLMNGKNVTVAKFIDLLMQNLDRPVLDKTGFTDPFDFTLEWDGERRLSMNPDAASPSPQKPSLFTAIQEQLGLKLDPQKAPTEVLVIDHVEKPSGN